MPILMTVAALVVLSGWRLLWIASGGFDVDWISSTHGVFLFSAGVVGTIMYTYGMLAMRPKAAKIGAIGAAVAASGQPPTQEQQDQIALLKGQMKVVGNIVGVLMAVTVIMMSVARYVY